MKSFLIPALLMLMSMTSSGQSLNADGLFVDNDGALFTGTINKMQNETRVELSVKEGKAEGPAYYYYSSGKLMEAANFSAGEKHGKWVRYTESGSLSAVAFYNLGKKTGTWLVYDEQGNKRFEMNYIDGEKSGTWTNWDEKGKIVSTKDYSKLH